MEHITVHYTPFCVTTFLPLNRPAYLSTTKHCVCCLSPFFLYSFRTFLTFRWSWAELDRGRYCHLCRTWLESNERPAGHGQSSPYWSEEGTYIPTTRRLPHVFVMHHILTNHISKYLQRRFRSFRRCLGQFLKGVFFGVLQYLSWTCPLYSLSCLIV